MLKICSCKEEDTDVMLEICSIEKEDTDVVLEICSCKEENTCRCSFGDMQLQRIQMYCWRSAAVKKRIQM